MAGFAVDSALSFISEKIIFELGLKDARQVEQKYLPLALQPKHICNSRKSRKLSTKAVSNTRHEALVILANCGYYSENTA